jgi:hypothetical protein
MSAPLSVARHCPSRQGVSPLQHRSRRAVGAALTAAVLGLGLGPAAAQASHLTGGTITASIDGAGVLTGQMLWYEKGDCSVGDESGEYLYINAPDGSGAASLEREVALTAFRCTASTAYYRGTFTQNLKAADALGEAAPAGRYTVAIETCCRVGGIANGAGRDIALSASARFVPGQATGSPQMLSSVPLGFGIGSGYDADLSPVDPDGGSIVVALLQGADSAQANYDWAAPLDQRVAVGGDNHVRMTPEQSQAYQPGDAIAYKVRAADAQGDAADYDVLVTATDNAPPVLASGPTAVTAAPGQRTTVPVVVTDADTGQTITIEGDGLPAWAQLTATAGNPASGELVLTPPADLTGTFSFSVVAYDDDDVMSLETRRRYTVTVAVPVVQTPAPTVVPAAVPAPAVTPAPAAPRKFRVIALRAAASQGRGLGGNSTGGTLILDVPGPGRIETEAIAVELPAATARSAAARTMKLFARSKTVTAGGRVSVDIKLTRKSLKLLAKHGLMKVRVKAKYIPLEGDAVEVRRTLSFKRFSMLFVRGARLSSDGRALRLIARVPYNGRLRAVARGTVGGKTIALGTSTIRTSPRGERDLVVRLNPRAVARLKAAGQTSIRVTTVLTRKGTSEITRTRAFDLAALGR